MQFSVPEFDSDEPSQAVDGEFQADSSPTYAAGYESREMLGPLLEPEPVRTAADLLGDGFWAHSRSESGYSFSRRSLELLGLTSSDSADFAQVLSPEDHRQLKLELDAKRPFEMVVEVASDRLLIKGWPEDLRGERIVGTLTRLPNELRATLESQDSLLAEAMEYGPDSMLVLRAIRNDAGEPVDFEVVESNSRGAEELGYTRDEAKGELIGQLRPSARENGVIDHYIAVMQTGRPSEQEFHVERGFQQIWMRERVIPLQNGVAVFAADVSSARRAGETADRSRRMFERIASTTPDALLLWDVDTKRLLYHNRELSALLGLGDRASSKLDFSSLEQHLARQNVERFRAYVASLATAKDERTLEEEFNFLTVEGKGHFLLFRSSVFDRKGNGHPKTILTSAQDVTEQASYHSNLEQRMQELNEARTELEARQQELLGLNLRLSDLALTDALTGVKNRRAFQEKLDEEVERAQRYNSRLALLLADVDHFKTYNDKYGHPAGDQALRAFAQVLTDVCRRSDTIARYGGEEFAIILPNTGADEAGCLGDRVRANLVGTPYGGQGVTASIGCSEFLPGKDGKDRLVSEADKALYQSKEAGRDRVTVFKA